MARYTVTGKLIQKYRTAQGLPKSTLATMIGVEYKGLIDKLEDGSRRAPKEIEIKLLKFLGIPVEKYLEALMEDYRQELLEELKPSTIETSAKKVEGEEWKNLI